jgi:hypothetical protein
MLRVTAHAIEQFASRWRPEAPPWQARNELKALAANAVKKGRTLARDADLYEATSYRGELLYFAVRDKTVLTVIPEHGERPHDAEAEDPELLEDSRATVEACRAMLATDAAPPPPNDTIPSWTLPAPPSQEALETASRARRISALDLLRDWKRGRRYTNGAVTRALTVLGLGPNDPLPEG